MNSLLLLDWFAENQRPLPWRRTYDPYQVWVSEIMLQQTQMKTVLPYFERFMERFPTVKDLAKAELDNVLQIWQGLGYYARARNLWKTAQQLTGKPWPRTKKEWLALPGIGDYVAAAISSIAFEAPEVVIDGNVKRVMARVLASNEDPRSELEATLPQKDARKFNQALMELGALICTPQNPQCEICPLKSQCLAYQRGRTAEFPEPKKRAATEAISVVVALIFNANDEVFMQKRPAKGLMGGLWEFPGGKVETGETPEVALEREIQEELGITLKNPQFFMKLRHAYTRFKVELSAYISQSHENPQTKLASKWVPISELEQLAFPAANQKLIRALKKTPFSGRMEG